MNGVGKGPDQPHGNGFEVSVQKLLTSGFHLGEPGARQCVQMLRKATTLEEFEQSMRENNWSTDLTQALLPTFREMFGRDEKLRQKTLERLKNLGVEDSFIEDYILRMDDQPYLVLRMDYSAGKTRDWADVFVKEADKLIFETCKRLVE